MTLSQTRMDMQWPKRCIVMLFLLLPALLASAQTQTIYRLKQNIRQAPDNITLLQGIFDLCAQGYTLHTDTLMYYAQKADSLAKKIGDRHSEIKALYFISYALTTRGLIDSSLDIANECLGSLIDSKHPDIHMLKGKLFNQKGRCFMRKNQYKEAINMGYQVVQEGEAGKDTLLQMQGKTLIGWAYLEMGQVPTALNWHLKALHSTGNTALLQQYSILFANLALNYKGVGNMDSAFYYIEQAVRYSRQEENLFALSNSLAIQAQLYVTIGQTAKAEPLLEETVAIRKLIGDPFYIISDMSQLGLFYAHSGKPEKGIAICQEGIAIARNYNMGTKLIFLYSALAENHKVLGNTTRYIELLEEIISLKDSIYQANTAEAIAEMQTKYEAQKKESIIMQQQLSLVKKNYQIYGSMALLALTMVAGWLLFRGYRKRQKLNTMMLVETEKRNAREAIKEAEEKERKRIATDLHDNLGAFAASMAANLDYVQPHITDEHSRMAYRELRINSQSIISQLNDTIWVLKKDALSLTAISDRIKVFIQQLQPSYPHVTIDVDESIDHDHWLTSSQAFHLYRIIQEAVTNALKHSKGSHILVKFTGNASWSIGIADDGSGMNNPTGNSGGGNGLANMRSRCREAGWNIDWFDNQDGGTTVVITPTIN